MNKLSYGHTGKPQNRSFTNSEDPDEMPQIVAFHQGLHCLLKQNQSSEKEMCFFFFKI